MTHRPDRRAKGGPGWSAARLAVLFATLLASAACGSDPTVPPAGDDRTLAASKAGIVALAVALAPSGHGFFDNFLACPRRGVIDYRDTERGRHFTLAGCDTGDGVVLDGSAELEFPLPGGVPVQLTTVQLTGNIAVRIDGEPAEPITSLTIRDLSFGAPASDPSLDALAFGAARIVVDGRTLPLDSRARPAHVFDPPLGIDAIPNTTASLNELTQVDLRYVAFHASNALARILVNETLETQRGDHRHDLPCGTMLVTVDPARNLPRLTMTAWNQCDLGYGLRMSGDFTVEWLEISEATGRMAMIVDGSLTMGGGIPRTSVERLEWTVSGISTLPASVLIEGRLVAGGNQRGYAFSVVVDD